MSNVATLTSSLTGEIRVVRVKGEKIKAKPNKNLIF